MNKGCLCLMMMATALYPQAASAAPTGAAFLNVTPSARAYALGMSEVVFSLGAQAIGANPANLGIMNQRFAAFTAYAQLPQGTQYTHLAVAFARTQPQILTVDSVGISVTRLGISGLQGADRLGNKTGLSFGASDLALSLGGSGRLSPGLRVGGTAKMLQSQIADHRSGMSLACDLGLTYTLERNRPISFGASLNNVGQGIKFQDQRDQLPTSLNLGAAMPLGPMVVAATASRKISAQRTDIGLGIEYGLGPMAFRVGYLHQDSAGSNLALRQGGGATQALGALSGGIGLRVGAIGLDYAMSQQAVEFGTTHRVSFSIQWGSRTRTANTQAQPRPMRDLSEWREQPDRSDWYLRSMGNY